MVNINYIRASDSNFTYGRSGRKIDRIVVHYTATQASAQNNGIYFSRPGANASAHYFIDGSGTITQSVSDGDTAWHAGDWDMNLRSIGIEVVSDGRDFSQAEIDELQWLVTKLMREYGVQWYDVIRHYDVTGKLCPAPYVDAINKWRPLQAYITTEKVEVPVKSPWVKVQLYHSNATHAQRWWREYTGETMKIGDYECRQVMLKNVASGKYLDVYEALIADGNAVGVFPGNNTNAQKWWEEEHIHDAETFIVFRSCLDEEFALDIKDGLWDDGTQAQIYTRYIPSSNVAQQFSYVFAGWPEGKECYSIVNQISGKNLDVYNAGN